MSGTLDDAEAAVAFLSEERGVEPRDMILYGFSLGNGPTLHLAALLRGTGLRGVILRSPFSSGAAVASDLANRYGSAYVPVGALPWPMDVWPNARLARDVDAPVLVIHGDRDELISPWQPRQILENIPQQYRVEPFFRQNMGHFDVEKYPGYIARLREFIHAET